MKLNLHHHRLYLRYWPEHSKRIWKDLTAKLERTAASAGQSGHLENTKKKIRSLIRMRHFNEIIRSLVSRLYARALVSIWVEEPDKRSISLTHELLDGLIEHQGKLSTLTLTGLIDIYFREFDLLNNSFLRNKAGPEKLAGIIKDQLNMRSKARPTLNHEPLLRNPEIVLSPDAPKIIAEGARNEDFDLPEYMQKQGWGIAAQGRFLDICQGIYYLDTLCRIPVGYHDSVLNELKKPEIHKMPYEGERRIGHAALEIVIDRSGNQASDVWRNFVVEVAGDPRIIGGRNFRNWWQPLGENRIDKVRGWLSKVDIKVFLKALEDWSQSQSNEDIRRMLPARQRFIQGLYDAGWLRRSRLILGLRVGKAVRSRLDKEESRIHFSRYDKSDTAIIALDCGEFYIVEGSHSFKIWIYLAPPARDMLFDYSIDTFSHQALIRDLPQSYEAEYPELEYLAQRHYPNIGWQHKVLSFLGRQGIEVRPEDVLTQKDYDMMLRSRKYGMPVIRRFS